MIVVVARAHTDAERRADLIGIGQRVASASRAEPGCIQYQVCQDSEDENAFVFVEEWESEEALQQHFRSPHIAEFMAAISRAILGPPEVNFHTIASSRDLAGVGMN